MSEGRSVCLWHLDSQGNVSSFDHDPMSWLAHWTERRLIDTALLVLVFAVSCTEVHRYETESYWTKVCSVKVLSLMWPATV